MGAGKANTYFSAMFAAPEDFLYLKKKNVLCYGLRWRADLKQLAVPLRDIKGNIQSIQWIYEDGTKRFFESSSIKAAFFSIGIDLLSYESMGITP